MFSLDDCDDNDDDDDDDDDGIVSSRRQCPFTLQAAFALPDTSVENCFFQLEYASTFYSFSLTQIGEF